ncbi:unnamed protein product [Adineta steineri]|uniref:EGF-like domain-containing protein n=1 Tax=Adineta steineri TaxID=433720 RepID=A0A819Q7J0_9BILA|nr:unnamed protein product [Adineta steineri]
MIDKITLKFLIIYIIIIYFIHLSPSHDGVLGQSSPNARSVLECLEWDISSKKVIFGRENKAAGNDDNSLNLTDSTLDINRNTGEIAVLDDNNRRIIIFNSSNSSKLITILFDFDSSNSTISNVLPSTFAYDHNYTMYVLDGVNKEIVRMNNPLEFGKNSTKIFDWSSYSQQIGVPPAGGLCIDNTDDSIFINDGYQIFLYNQSISNISVYIGSTTTGNAMIGNAMTSNAMTGNAITSNAMTGNAITSNAMTGNAMTSNAMTGGATTGNAADEFNNPTSVVTDNYQRLFVNDVGNNRIQMFEFNSQNGITLQTNISHAKGLSLYLPDILVINTNTAVYLYNLTDNITTCAIGCNTTELNNIHNALIDNQGNIIVTDSNAVVLYPISQQCSDITTDSTITTTMSTNTITTSMTSTNQFTNVTIQSTTTTPQSTTTITTATTTTASTTTENPTTEDPTSTITTTASTTTENPTTEDPTSTITTTASTTTENPTTEDPTTTITTTASQTTVSPTTENPTTKTTTAASSTTTIRTTAGSTTTIATTASSTTTITTAASSTTTIRTTAGSTTTITTAASSTTTITTAASSTTTITTAASSTTKTTTASSSTTTITTAVSSTIMTTITTSTTTTTTTAVQPNFNPINNCTSGSFGINCMFTDSICNTTQLCFNNGSCIENKTLENGYSCDCLEGFEGIDCQDDERLCKPFTCFDRGNCTNISSIDFKCTCDDGYQGKNCEITVDLCNNVTCQNGGVCFQTYFNYTCQCLSGYKGLHCEIAETSAIIRTYVAKSFGYIAILMLCGLIGFLVILDALKYIFGIDPAKSQRKY